MAMAEDTLYTMEGAVSIVGDVVMEDIKGIVEDIMEDVDSEDTTVTPLLNMKMQIAVVRLCKIRISELDEASVRLHCNCVSHGKLLAYPIIDIPRPRIFCFRQKRKS